MCQDSVLKPSIIACTLIDKFVDEKDGTGDRCKSQS